MVHYGLLALAGTVFAVALAADSVNNDFNLLRRSWSMEDGEFQRPLVLTLLSLHNGV